MSQSKELYVKCQSCKAEIIFCLTKKGNLIPVNFNSLTEDDRRWLLNRTKEFYNTPLGYRYGEHIPHFATCPNANQFRKKKDDTPNKQERPNEDATLSNESARL